MNKAKALITAELLDGNGGSTLLDWEQIEQWKPEQGGLWIHLNYTMPRAKKWLKSSPLLEPSIFHAMISEETRPRALLFPKGIFCSLRGVNLNPGEDPEDMVGIRCWITSHCIITTRRRRLLSIDDIRSALSQGSGPTSPTHFLAFLIERLTDRISDVIEAQEEVVSTLEESILQDGTYALRSLISDSRRKSILIRRYLAPQREALNRLSSGDNQILSANERAITREMLDRVIRYIEDLDAGRDRLTVLQEEITNNLTEQMNQRMYILSVVAVIFLPLTFITGLLGINVAGIPGAESSTAFFNVCLLLMAFILLMIWVFHKKKWI